MNNLQGEVLTIPKMSGNVGAKTINIGGCGGAEAVIEPLSVSENGTYTAPDGVDGYSPVTVNVPIPDGYIQPSGALDVTENGAHDVSAYASVNVNVSIGSGGGVGSDIDKLIDKTITDISSDVLSVGVYAFHKCSSLVGARFPNATSIGEYAFDQCNSLEETSIQNATTLGANCFSGCKKLNSADFPKAESIGDYAFAGCSGLSNINFPNVTKIGNYAFQNIATNSVVFQKATTLGNYAFHTCPQLESVDFHELTKLGSGAFRFGYSLKTVIIRSPTVCNLVNSNAFTSSCYHFLGEKNQTYNPTGAKDGYIYVPSALVESYKAATNWSTFASQIRAIEDYPEITGG